MNSAKLPDDVEDIAAFDLIPSTRLASGRCEHIKLLSVGLVSMVDASQREQASFFFPASSKMFQAHDAMRINFVGDFVVAWDDASMAAESLEDAAVRSEDGYNGNSTLDDDDGDRWGKQSSSSSYHVDFGSRSQQQAQATQF